MRVLKELGDWLTGRRFLSDEVVKHRLSLFCEFAAIHVHALTILYRHLIQCPALHW